MLKDKKTEDIEQVEEVRRVEKPIVSKRPADVDKFIERKLRVINGWPDGAKKRAAAERLFRNKEAKV